MDEKFFTNKTNVAISKDVLMEALDWFKDLLLLKVVLRSARVTDGVLCVIMDGKDQTQLWFVDS